MKPAIARLVVQPSTGSAALLAVKRLRVGAHLGREERPCRRGSTTSDAATARARSASANRRRARAGHPVELLLDLFPRLALRHPLLDVVDAIRRLDRGLLRKERRIVLRRRDQFVELLHGRMLVGERESTRPHTARHEPPMTVDLRGSRSSPLPSEISPS